MIDRYTKTVLTVIAAALVALVIQELAPKAKAQSGKSCGSTVMDACYVEIRLVPLAVELVR